MKDLNQEAHDIDTVKAAKVVLGPEGRGGRRGGGREGLEKEAAQRV